MGIFDRAKTSRSSVNSNAALQTGEGSIGLNLSNVGGGGKYAKTDVNISLTDYGAVDRAFEAVDSSFEFAAGAVSRVLDSSDAARVDSLMFGAGAMQAAFEESERARQDAARTRQAAMHQIEQTQERAHQLVRENNAQALQFSAGAFQAALSEVDASHARSVGTVIDFSNDAIEYVAESTKSEASQSFDKLVKTAGWAVGAMAVVQLLPRLL
ncbi:MAG: hypothetical protein AB2758_20705 [Candidatus Thiodiazotropha endolucinida]